MEDIKGIRGDGSFAAMVEERMIKTYCEVCGRQVTHNNASNDREAPLQGARMGVHGIMCGDCSEDLDDNGNYPEEY